MLVDDSILVRSFQSFIRLVYIYIYYLHVAGEAPVVALLNVLTNALELFENRFLWLPHHALQDVETTAVRHPDHNLVDVMLEEEENVIKKEEDLD